MPPILCTQTLWRRLGNPDRVPFRAPESGYYGVSLGAWATKVFRYDRRDLVVAMDERTCATLLFPLAPRRRFRSNFADALAALLADVEVPAEAIAAECAALHFAPIARLQSGVLADTLAQAQVLCELDLFDVSDLRHIQLHVSEYPFAIGMGSCPIEALAMVFAGAGVRSRTH